MREVVRGGRSIVEPLFRDRVHAGRILAERLRPPVDNQDVIVLALPRGGVPVALRKNSKLIWTSF